MAHFNTRERAEAFVARRGEKITDVTIKLVEVDTTLFADIFHS